MASLLTRLPRPRGNATDRRTLPTPALAALAGAVVLVAGLVGLSVAVVVVQTLDPAAGLSVGGSTRLAGRLLLLAQGGELRVASGPLVVAPLALTLALAWGLSRAARTVVRVRDLPPGRTTAAVAGAITGAHLLGTLVLAAAVDGHGARVGWLRTVVGAVVLAVVAAGWGAARESGDVDAVLDRLPGPVRPLLPAVLAGLLTALGLCIAVVAVALAADASGYAALQGSLGGGAAGAVGLAALGALLLPNAGAAVLGLAAGPGFVVGSATFVSVHGVRLGAVPDLPLLAALPDTQAVPLLAFLSQAIPALAGLAAGVTLGRRFTDDDGGSVVAGLWGIVTGAGLGLAAVLVTAVGGGSLGDGALATVGAPPLTTGLAVALQSGIAAALAAAVARWRAEGCPDLRPGGWNAPPARLLSLTCPLPSRPRGPGSSCCSPARARSAPPCWPPPTTPPTPPRSSRSAPTGTRPGSPSRGNAASRRSSARCGTTRTGRPGTGSWPPRSPRTTRTWSCPPGS